MKQKTRQRSGFTLAETLLTVAVIAALLALGIVAYTQWIRAVQFRRNNLTAETMFSALQNELSERRAGNTLEEVETIISRGGDGSGVLSDGTAVKTPGGADAIDYQTIYEGYYRGANDIGPERGPIYYVKGTASDWEKYNEDPGSISSQPLRLVYDMLSEYLLKGDKDLLNGSICVEFDPAEGMVYSVFFSEQADELTYQGSEANLIDRTKKARRKHTTNGIHDLVGYCGVETLSVSTSKVTTKPIVQNLVLSNEETLNLSFNLNIGMATKLMSYAVSVFDADTDTKRLTIEMNNITTDDGALWPDIYKLQEGQAAVVDCRVTRYENDKKQEEMMSFPAWLDDDGKITLVLDAVDYYAASQSMQDAYDDYVQQADPDSLFVDALKNTFSIYRLGIEDTDNIYCTVYAEGGGFRTSATKTSNITNRAFSSSDRDNNEFTIANARHLYNLRFEETEDIKAAGNSYILRNDVDINDIQVYSNYKEPAKDKTILSDVSAGNGRSVLLTDLKTDGRTLFPSFELLGEDSSFTSKNGGNTCTISNLSVTKDHNIEWMHFEPATEDGKDDADTNGTGLFLINRGSISNVQLSSVKVDGTTKDARYHSDRTGAFCGTNAGVLAELKTLSDKNALSAVKGENYVGGIFGYLDTDLPASVDAVREISDLSNAAAVTGNRYVGGITGLLEGKWNASGDKSNIVLKKCENYGLVLAKKADDAFIGGIVGLADSVEVRDCISNPRYGAADNTEKRNGYFVGGIVGLSSDAILSDCTTKLQKGYDTANVYGGRYVGGIVGFSAERGIADGKAAGNILNEANVSGMSYVGGIVGCNAKAIVSAGTVVPGETELGSVQRQSLSEFRAANGEGWYKKLDPTKVSPVSAPVVNDDAAVIAKWQNKGVVTARDYYAGGIAGYNTGRIVDCDSNVYRKIDTAAECDYAGGIAGYNNGIMCASQSGKTLNVECVVTGRNFVGGVVGYNDVNAIVQNYKVIGGTVQASENGAFVGGYAGLNASENMLQDENGKPVMVAANLNKISGGYAVGGTIGGNIVPVTSQNKSVKAAFNVDNFRGSISGQGLVGGYIGCNAMPLVSDIDAVRDNWRGNIQKNIAEVMNASGSDAVLTAIRSLEAFARSYGENTAGLEIGEADGSFTTMYSSGISGKAAVGGVVGYNSDSTALKISNVENKAPVKATEAIPVSSLNGLISGLENSAVNNGNETYSLAGGIIGIVGVKTTIVNCRNRDIGDVSAQGTYLGGLAEVNLGKIQDCFVAAIGNTSHHFTGGLAGINFGTIEGTKAINTAVTGNSYVGGITAENYGRIVLDGAMNGLTVRASGSYAGGVTGFNGVSPSGKRGTIEMQNGLNNVNVTSDGSVAGGVIGLNQGGDIATGSSAANDAAAVSGRIVGADVVGGIIGEHKSGNLTALMNKAFVNAVGTSGNAAGIVGRMGGSSSILGCVNKGTVLSSTGNAAGIVGINSALVKKCRNEGSVTAPGGSAGGICVENNNRIEDCTVASGTDVVLTIQGNEYTGGIAAQNNGTMTSCMLKSVTVTNYADSPNTGATGGMAGINTGTIKLAAVQEANDLSGVNAEAAAQNMIDVTVKTQVNGSSVGGVVGCNDKGGVIDGGVDGNDVYTLSGQSECLSDGSEEPMPTGYTVYDYVETKYGSTNAQGSYFDTGYAATSKTTVVFDGCVMAGDTALFGARKASGNEQFCIQYASDKTYTAKYADKSTGALTKETGIRSVFTMSASGASQAVNGSVIKTVSYSSNAAVTNRTMLIGGLNTNGNVGNLGRVRMYSMEIYENVNGEDVLQHKFVPASDADGNAGILDIANIDHLTFIPYSSKGGSFNVELGGTGRPYEITPEGWQQNNLTISVGSAVTFANVGNVAGVNMENAVIQNISLKNIKTNDSVSALLGGEEYGCGGITGMNGGLIDNAFFSGAVAEAGSSAAIANVGGIVGKNLAEGCVRKCAVGRHGRTSVSASVYGFVGGIAGWNLGSVESCDNRVNADSEEDSNIGLVTINNVKGHTGGIIGNQAPGAYLGSTKEEPTATGEKWLVWAREYANDCGTGGIIGYSESGNRGENLSYLVNNASVINSAAVSSSLAIGGIIGRFQNNENGAMVLEHCENHGSIDGSSSMSLSGGMVGRIKYLGAAFEECINSGNVSGNTVGGILGDAYLNTTGNYFISCQNSGDIAAGTYGGARAGGILGRDTDGGMEAWLFDCVNTGDIRGNADNTGAICGIVAKVALGSTTGTQLIRCRNYGKAYNGTESNPAGLMYSTARASASSTNANNRCIVQDCFDLRTEKSLLSARTDNIYAVDSYFYSGGLSGAEETAIKNWSGAMQDETAQAVKTAVNASGSLHSADIGKSGLPASYYRDGDVLHLTSYRVYDVQSNPLAGIGIPNRTISNTENEAYTSGGVTSENLYTYLESGGSDSLIQRYYRDKYAALEADTAVTNLKLKQTGGVIDLSWTAVPGAYAYKICYEICDEDGNTTEYAVLPVTYGTTCQVKISEEWNKCTFRAYVRAVSGEEGSWTEQTFTEKGTIPEGLYWTEDNKDGWAGADLNVRNVLPTPDVYLELEAMTSDNVQATDGSYVAVLRNTSEFDEYLKDYPAGTVINISVGGAGSYTISYIAGDPMSAHSKTAHAAHATSGNLSITATATHKDANGTNISMTLNRQTWMVSAGILKRLTLLNVDFDGLTGRLPEELVFGMRIAASKATGEIASINNNITMYQESELLANRTIDTGDQTVMLPMVVSENISRLNKEDNTLDIVLDDLPDDLLEDEDPLTGSGGFTVRSYLMYGQNNAYFTGHDVCSGASAEELLDLTDPQRGGEAVFSKDAEGHVTLNKGYVVQQVVAEDESISYSVWYNAQLADADAYKNCIYSCTYTFDPSADGRDENNLVKVQGDVQSGRNNSTASIQPYPLAECAATADSSQYKVTWNDSPDETTDADGQYYLQLYGRDAVSGSVVLLKTTKVLDKNSRDELGGACYSAADGWQYTFVDSEEEWNYADITMRVTKVGTEEKGVTTIWPYYNDCSMHLKQWFTTMTAPVITAPEDSGTMDYSMRWNTIPEDDCDDFLCYEITIRDVTESEEHTEAEAQILYAVYDGDTLVLDSKMPDTPQKMTGETCEAILHMDAFEGCQAAVSVRAITRTDAGYPVDYRNGAAGTPRTLQLATRLLVPDSEITMDPCYDAEETALREDIEAHGVTLTVEGNEKYADVSGQYEIRFGISDTDAENDDMKVIALSDSTRFMTGRLNEDSSTYIVPDELITEDGETLHLSELAGKYLSVSLRATSDNAISSGWTEPVFLKLPRMQLTAPDVQAGDAAVHKYKVYGVTTDGQQTEMLNEDNTSKLINVKQETFSWENDTTDGGYSICLTWETDSVDNVPQREAREYVLVRDENGLRLGNQYLKADGTTWYPLEGCTIRVRKDNVASWQYVYTDISAYIQVSEDKITVCLPDNSENDAAFTGFATSGTWTKNLTVTALSQEQASADGTPANYTDSMGSCLTRVTLDNKTEWESTLMDRTTLPVVNKDGTVNAITTYQPDKERIYTQLAVNGRSSYRLMVQLTYRNAVGEERVLESAMQSVLQPQEANCFDLAKMPGDWKQITGVRYRLICVSDRELIGDWSEIIPLNIAKPVTSDGTSDTSDNKATSDSTVVDAESEAAGDESSDGKDPDETDPSDSHPEESTASPEASESKETSESGEDTEKP